MAVESPQKTSLKQKAAHEFTEIAIVFTYLAVFFCALTTYSMLLLDQYHISYFNYGAALINALVITKVILIGEAVHVGEQLEAKPLFYSTVYKAFVFGLLVFAFHVVEEVIKRLVHGKDIVGTFHEVRLDDLLARSVIIFLTFIPLFAFRELGRVLGQDKFRNMMFRTSAAPPPIHRANPET
jgi:hypothetical protein